MQTDVCALLQSWCDALLKYQIKDTGDPQLDGALLCPACQTIHGRCGELVYPLLTLCDRLGRQEYLEAARKLFDWSGSLFCSDGAMLNDGQSMWKGITVFAAVSLCDALRRHGHLLTAEEKQRWEQRLRAHGDWILTHIDEHFDSNINYNAAAAGSLALLGNYFHCEAYLEHADRMARYAVTHVEADGLFYGEGKPIESLTAKGCRPVDIGYNVEESLPLLLLYARQRGNEDVYRWVKKTLKDHLEFMLPDGGWDNSFGTRNFKWTYWGSRTSEGCIAPYAHFGKTDPQCAAAAARNLELMCRCSRDGLLAGGPDYPKVGARACLHHSFSHARVLAELLDEDLIPQGDAPLPCETAPALKYYPTIDTWRVHLGDWYADVTAYDFTYHLGGHASGGTLSLLWHKKNGLMIASSMTRYSLYEAHNMQQLTDRELQKSLTPRVECRRAGELWASCWDNTAVIRAVSEEGGVYLEARGTLSRIQGDAMAEQGKYRLGYRFRPEYLEIEVWTSCPDCCFLLPMAGGAAEPAAAEKTVCFSLAGGLLAQEHRWELSAGTAFTVRITP